MVFNGFLFLLIFPPMVFLFSVTATEIMGFLFPVLLVSNPAPESPSDASLCFFLPLMFSFSYAALATYVSTAFQTPRGWR